MALSIVVLVILGARSGAVLTADVLPTGDAAADVLLVERASHEWLLTGHYSRFGFHHPGPFFLAIRHATVRIVGRALPGPYNAHLLGALLGNAFFAGVGGAVAARLAGGGWHAAAAGLAAVVVVLLQAGPGGVLSATWMPNVLVAPFFAFVLLLAQVALGRLDLLPLTTFCAGALAHGNVVLLPIVAVAWPAAVATGVVGRKRAGGTVPRRVVIASAVIVLAFAAPPLLDVALHFPGNPGRILDTALHAGPDAARPWSAALRFVEQYWTSLAPLPAGAAFVAALIATRERPSRRALGAVAATILLVSVLLLVVAKRAPDTLYAYIGRFYLGAPLALSSAAFALAIARLRPPTARLATAVLAVLLGVVAVRVDLACTEGGDPSLRGLTTAIRRDARQRGVDTIALAFTPDDQWPAAAGLLVDLMRARERPCVAAPGWAVLFTPERLCLASAGVPRYVVVDAAACGDVCLARGERTGIVWSAGAATAAAGDA